MSDLGVQLLEWWAYLGDILDFYNERRVAEATVTRPRQPKDQNGTDA
jgi:hypothetical protein